MKLSGEVSIEHLQWVLHANRGCLLLWTHVPVPLWDLHNVLMLRPISLKLVLFPDFAFGTSILPQTVIFHCILQFHTTFSIEYLLQTM